MVDEAICVAVETAEPLTSPVSSGIGTGHVYRRNSAFLDVLRPAPKVCGVLFVGGWIRGRM
jgi:hypothetical protein